MQSQIGLLRRREKEKEGRLLNFALAVNYANAFILLYYIHTEAHEEREKKQEQETMRYILECSSFLLMQTN